MSDFFRNLFNKSIDKWVFIGCNESITDYYDPTSVKILRDLSSIQVTCKRVYSAKGKQKLFNYWETRNLSRDEIDDIHHAYTSYIFAYEEKQMTLLVTTYVSYSDKVIVGYMFQTNDIKPGTVDESILKKYIFYPSEGFENIKPGSINEVIFNKIINDYNL